MKTYEFIGSIETSLTINAETEEEARKEVSMMSPGNWARWGKHQDVYDIYLSDVTEVKHEN